jgi:hypothetical protein
MLLLLAEAIASKYKMDPLSAFGRGFLFIYKECGWFLGLL